MRIRFFIVWIRALLRGKPGSMPGQSVLSFRVMPWDCVLRYMGNDPYHSFMDLGRVDLAFRLGWINTLYKQWWQPQVVGSFARYGRPLGLFDHFVLRTYVIHTNGVSVWLLQHFEKDGIVHYSAISKLVAVSGSRVVPLKPFINGKQGIPKWTASKNAELLFNQSNALLKQLPPCPF